MAERITRAAQENLISLLAHSNKHGKLIATLVDPELFEGDYRVIATKVIDYWRQHNKAPRVHTGDLLSDVIHDKKNRRSETYRRILRDMQALAKSGEINVEYVMQQLQQFTRLQHMKDAILRSADILQKQQELGITDVETMLADLMRAREFNFDQGLSLKDAIPRVQDFLEKRMSEFTIGIKHLDEMGIVPYRRAVMLFLAPTGRGKSWFLIRVGKQALLQRKKVLHITMEMDEDEVSMRYYQSLFAQPKKDIEGKLTMPRLLYEKSALKVPEKSIIREIRLKEIDALPSFGSDAGMKLLYENVDKWGRQLGHIKIKRFPMRSITVEQLDAYLDTLEATGFSPDMLILDYLSIMKTMGGAKDYRISLGRTMEDFRGMLQKRNIAGVTAAQVGRVGMEARTLKTTHIAEDISLINTSDVALTYSQTEAEREMGLARVFVDKARSDLDHFGVVITQNYAIGQFALQSARLNVDYYGKVPGFEGKGGKGKDGGDEDAGDDDEGEESPKRAGKWRD